MTTHDSALMSYGAMADTNEDRRSSGTAFLLWLACALGICGVHRFYVGKPITGLLYLFTFGLLGIGQLVDLFLIRGLVREANGAGRCLPRPLRRARPLALPPREAARTVIIQAAARHGGQLSVAQAVAASGIPEQEAEKILDGLVLDGTAEIDNHPETGAVIYTFSDLRR